MATDSSQIQLSESERKELAELAERTGKPWGQVLAEALAEYRRQASQPKLGGAPAGSVYDALKRSGLLGRLTGGPADLSTNPTYMEGFGADDH